MTWFRRLFASKARAERQLDEELRFHVDELADANQRAGMPPEEARRRALIALGGVEKTRHAYRDTLGARLLRDFAQDVRYGLRQLRRSGVSAQQAPEARHGCGHAALCPQQ